MRSERRADLVAHTGAGIWLRGPFNVVTNNVVSDAAKGYVIAPYMAPDARDYHIPTGPGADPRVAGQFLSVDLHHQPLTRFAGNEVAGGTGMGLSIWEVNSDGPSGWAGATSMVLINFRVFVSNIETGRLLVKPWPDFGSTAAPFPPTPSISPTGSSVSRLNICSRVGTAGVSGRVSVAGTAGMPRRGM